MGVMRRSGFAALFLLYIAIFSGCGQREKPYLYIYCNETFWYVMQEEALFFNKIYGFQVVLIPIRAERTSDKEEDTVAIGTDRHSPTPWRSRPGGPANQQTTDPSAQINPDIESQITRIAETGFGDLLLSDSQRHIDKLHKIALSANEFVVCYLTLAMLVPEGNPHRFRSAKDVLDSNRRLGIVDPSLDGLGESSWQMLGKIVPGGESAIPRDLVRFYERQYDLLEALERGQIDAALIWNATSLQSFLLEKYADKYNAKYEYVMRKAERKKDWTGLRSIYRTIGKQIVEENSFAEVIPLTQNPNERSVSVVRLVTLGSAANYGFCERFVDFMRSKQGKDILNIFGFVTE